MRRLIQVAVLLAFLASVTLSAAERRMTIEEALAVKTISSLQLSLDGERVVCTVSEWDQRENRRVNHIHLVRVDTGQRIKLTNGEKGESAPQWSPDGQRIAFLAERDKGTQIWIIAANGGEAEKLTSEENGVTSFQWSPDGRQIAFITLDTPPDKEAREKRKRDKFDTITIDRDLTYAHLWTISTVTREKKRLTTGSFSVETPRWSPDGQSIVYAASSAGRQESIFTDISNDRDTDHPRWRWCRPPVNNQSFCRRQSAVVTRWPLDRLYCWH
ncbi:MAG: hypothetical protein EBU88_09260 [Acidobacteria bacterium]|nr:hypothetical protein [Acidobacteriota bacterium]